MLPKNDQDVDRIIEELPKKVESFNDNYLHNTVLKNWNEAKDWETNLIHAVAGLNEEAGEVMGLVKKQFFYGKDFKENPRGIEPKHYIDELGDIAYYFFMSCHAAGVSVEHVMQKNAEKLAKRHANGFNGSYKKENEE